MTETHIGNFWGQAVKGGDGRAVDSEERTSGFSCRRDEKAPVLKQAARPDRDEDSRADCICCTVQILADVSNTVT